MIKNFLTKLYAALRKLHSVLVKKKVLVIGDSHAIVFNHVHFLIKFPLWNFEICSVQGATASGLENPNSKTQSYDKFMDSLCINKYERIVTILGEVDTGFIIWYRARKYGASVSDMLAQAICRYEKLLETVKEFAPVIVISTPLPTIGDDEKQGEVANLRKEVSASQRERTDLTLQFNMMIRKFCENNEIIFIDLDRESIGSDGRIKHKLKNKKRHDHHYDKYEYAKIIAQQLCKVM